MHESVVYLVLEEVSWLGRCPLFKGVLLEGFHCLISQSDILFRICRFVFQVSTVNRL